MENSTCKIYKSAEELQEMRLKEATTTTYTQRFYTLTKLIRISKMIANAKIISSPRLKEK